nr:MAG TPA: hypothetical protein [Bacteriophage sp.]
MLSCATHGTKRNEDAGAPQADKASRVALRQARQAKDAKDTNTQASANGAQT